MSMQLRTALNSFSAVPQGAGEGVRSMVLRLPLVYFEGPWTSTFNVPMFKGLQQIAKQAGFVPYLGSGENLRGTLRGLAASRACTCCHLNQSHHLMCVLASASTGVLALYEGWVEESTLSTCFRQGSRGAHPWDTA